MLNYKSIKASIVAASYCLYFFLLRLTLPHSLRNDEAEQILAAKTIELGYPKQPPLYSWINYLASQALTSVR